MSRWLDNPFRAEVLARMDAGRRHQAVRLMAWDERAQAWSQPSTPAAAVPPVPLQHPAAAFDVTDHGLVLLPLALDGRFGLVVGALLEGWGTVPADDGVDRRLLVSPGAVTLRCDAGTRGRCTVTVRAEGDAVVVDLRAGGSSLRPTLTWMPGRRTLDGDGLWLEPADLPAPDPRVSHNNSAVPDPPRPARLDRAGVLVTSDAPLAPVRADGTPPALVADRLVASGAAEVLDLGMAPAATARVVLRVGATAAEARAAREAPDAPGVVVAVPDTQVARQAQFSAFYGRFSRARRASGRDIFVHGRRDRGYGDVAHLHQSFQMHLPALAAGQAGSVRDELVEFSLLQDRDGALRRCPRPGSGEHPYVGLYTNAHFLLAVERYLAWTGDAAGVRAELLDPARRAAGHVLDQRAGGMVRPCGWLDAWPPDVEAQAQVSATAVMGLRGLAAVEAALGGDALGWTEAADAVAAAIVERCYDPRSGLFAEHAFTDGRVEGGTVEDFWAHTQIWAALAGLAPDARGLDLVRRHCMTTGVRVVPVSTLGSAYVADSTDGDDDLPVDSTATWLLAMWPELTHLFALAQLRCGDAGAALEAVRGALPERLHARSPAAAPYFYAEKYLDPGDRPWLCTWAGDPTLVEVLLSGFAGVRPTAEGVVIAPQVPGAWEGAPITAAFTCHGARWHLTVDDDLTPGAVLLDGEPADAGAPLRPAGRDHHIRVPATGVAAGA